MMFYAEDVNEYGFGYCCVSKHLNVFLKSCYHVEINKYHAVIIKYKRRAYNANKYDPRASSR